MRAAVRCIRGAAISRSGRLLHAGRPLTSASLKELIERTLLAAQCVAEDTIVAVGPQGARPHDAGSGPLRAGVPVVIDIFPRDKETGYWGDITRTVVRGPAPPAIRRMHRAVLAAQKLALAMIRPGVEVRAVQRAVEEHFRKMGYETSLAPPGRERGFIHGVGHGVGLDIHEAPGLRHESGRLRAGHVVTVEPGLYYPGIGGVRIEDTVVVTRTGHKILATFPRNL
jgi:Xaa-Pro aminopeptidase